VGGAKWSRTTAAGAATALAAFDSWVLFVLFVAGSLDRGHRTCCAALLFRLLVCCAVVGRLSAAQHLAFVRVLERPPSSPPAPHCNCHQSAAAACGGGATCLAQGCVPLRGGMAPRVGCCGPG
jgi:hypothetical protein